MYSIGCNRAFRSGIHPSCKTITNMLQCKLSQIRLCSRASNGQVRKYSNQQNPRNKAVTTLTIRRPNNPEHSHGLLGRQNTVCRSSSCKRVCDSHHENGNQIIYFFCFLTNWMHNVRPKHTCKHVLLHIQWRADC